MSKRMWKRTVQVIGQVADTPEVRSSVYQVTKAIFGALEKIVKDVLLPAREEK